MVDRQLTSKECHCRVCVGDHAGYGPCTKPEPLVSNSLAESLRQALKWDWPNIPRDALGNIQHALQLALEANSPETFERRLAEACERMRRAAAIVAIGGDQTMATAIYDHSRRLLGDIKPWWESENAQKAKV